MSDFVLSTDLKESYERHEKLKFQIQLESDSEFSQVGSYLILNGFPILDKIITDDQKLINDFNKKLKDNGINMCIRGIHKTKIGKKVYYYNGLYIFNGTGLKREYKGKFDPRDWKNILGRDQYELVGNLPYTQLPDIRFERVDVEGNPSNNIIIPQDNFLNSRIRKIFSTCTIFKLG